MQEKYNYLVSVIVPAFNVENYIKKCLDSIRCQSHENVEVIVVNDRSTDNTAAILETYSKEDERFKILNLEKNVGVHAARAEGLRVASGDYIGFVDSDDWVAPNMYERLLNNAIDHNADIVVCGADKVSENGAFMGSKVRFSKKITYDQEILSEFCQRRFGSGVLWNKIYRSRLIKKYGTVSLERKVDASEDYIVNVGCFSEAKVVQTINEKLYYYLMRSDSASRREDYGKNFSRMLKAYVSCLDIYTNFTSDQFNHVDHLFSSQMRNIDYQVEDLRSLEPYHEDLKDSLARLADRRPEAIYTLVNTFNTDEKNNRVKRIARKVYIYGRHILDRRVSS
ncbi:Glycosyl transferase family 2 [Modicisalibacter ilicicola DSM 19980]|uniref:Glycosyl transferase family 2 n=1 Tax=Modicisalibacter ilicicola DSM 19980 TaxID=1121942 RepID=A0A1M5BZG1_9GAMM|nr:glycosyltransferase family 2 protein [Halomonas ilicicola]SHF47924.1 Glycosyl transferase family 2 [Halomonas ilicicola DSM 19980]